MERPRTKRSRKTAILLLLGGGAVIILPAALSVCSLYGSTHVDSTPFNAEAWRSAPFQIAHNSPRQRMAKDLLESHPLIGLSRSAVEELLGPDDRDKERGFRKEYQMIYLLGRSSGQMEPDWLLIRLGVDGCVCEVVIRGD